ncbi:GNAT family N-acetyltransferase [Candidatus Acetothermia bacterium]|jgi:ribosomal protein S18 acetylase RimI-like enzyme|nr:GNAT family N-acetyltransferase [Candidatus Acetothermia bacterium]
MSVQIRTLRAKDVDGFVSLMLMAHSDDVKLFGIDAGKGAAQLRSALTNPLLRGLQAISGATGRFLVAVSGGEVVGLVGLTGQKVLEVVGTAVHPDYRGRGIGKALMEAILAEARRLGRDRVTVGVREDNLPAVRLYEQSGFQTYQRLSYVSLDLPFDRSLFLADEHAAVRHYHPADGERLVAVERRVLSAEHLRVQTSGRSRYEPTFGGRLRAQLLGLKRRGLVLVVRGQAVGFVLVRADASAHVGRMEELLMESEHAEHLPALLKAGLEFLEGAGKRRSLLTFPAEQEAVGREIKRLGFCEEMAALIMVCWLSEPAEGVFGKRVGHERETDK